MELSALGAVKLATGGLSVRREARRHYSQILMMAKRVDDAYVGEEPPFDDTPDEEVLEGDTGPLLIVQRTCLMPQAKGDEWL